MIKYCKKSKDPQILFIVKYNPLDSGKNQAIFITDDGNQYGLDLTLYDMSITKSMLLNACKEYLHQKKYNNKGIITNKKKVLEAYKLANAIQDFTYLQNAFSTDGCDEVLLFVKNDQFIELAFQYTSIGIVNSYNIVKILKLLYDCGFFRFHFQMELEKDPEDFVLKFFSEHLNQQTSQNNNPSFRKNNKCIIC